MELKDSVEPAFGIISSTEMANTMVLLWLVSRDRDNRLNTEKAYPVTIVWKT